jgi:hypothetical protein
VFIRDFFGKLLENSREVKDLALLDRGQRTDLDWVLLKRNRKLYSIHWLALLCLEEKLLSEGKIK